MKRTLVQDGGLSGWVERLGSLTPTTSVRARVNFAYLSGEVDSKCQQCEMASSLIHSPHPPPILSPSSLPRFLFFRLTSKFPASLAWRWNRQALTPPQCSPQRAQTSANHFPTYFDTEFSFKNIWDADGHLKHQQNLFHVPLATFSKILLKSVHNLSTYFANTRKQTPAKT